LYRGCDLLPTDFSKDRGTHASGVLPLGVFKEQQAKVVRTRLCCKSADNDLREERRVAS
jgi:hypothetical protein